MGSNEVVDLLLGLCLAAIVIVPGSIVLRLVRRARANERCFATLVEHLPSTGVTVLDESLRVEFAGGAALTDAGWPAQDVVGRSLHEVLPRDEADFLARQFRAGLAGESRSVEHHATRSGQDFALEIVPVTDAEGSASRALGICMDVSERRVAEVELGQHAVDVGALSEAMRALAGSSNPSAARTAVCEGARTVAAAPIAALLEPTPDGSCLEVASSLGADLRDLLVPFAGERSRAAEAFAGAEAVFVSDADSQSDIDREFVRRTRAVTTLWHPVLHHGSAIGVLVVAWRRRVAAYPPRLGPLMDVLAAAAAIAIGRAELLGRTERIARTDELTGLANRRAWEEELPREIARAWRGGTPLCVAMLDLDRFKGYNDSRGHQAGDRLLKEAAGAWRGMLRPYDLLARYGGEEFGVILPGCVLADAIAIVERLRGATPDGVSCSAGVAEWDGEEHPEALVGRADSALYEAKRSGRDRTVAGQQL